MNNSESPNLQVRRELVDPIPWEIILQLCTAVAAFGTLGYLIRRDWIEDHRTKKQDRHIFKNVLFSAFRDTKRIEVSKEIFATFVTEYGLEKEEIRMAGINLPAHEYDELKRLLREIRKAGDSLAEALGEVRKQIISEDELIRIGDYILGLDTILREALTAKTFGHSLLSMDRLIESAQYLLRSIGDTNDIETF